MSSEWHKKVNDLFRRACDLSPRERKEFLDDACAGSEEIRRDVESLLARDESPEASIRVRELEQQLQRVRDDLPDEAESQPRTIGAYNVLKAIGEGAMGVVYLAEQRAPVRIGATGPGADGPPEHRARLRRGDERPGTALLRG